MQAWIGADRIHLKRSGLWTGIFQGDYSLGIPGKPGKVREFQSGQGKVRENGKSHGKVGM